MTREHQPHRARRAELAVTVGAAAGALFMAEQVGAQQPTPAGFETLTPAAQAEVAQCGVSFANVMTEVPATPAAAATPDTIIATHIIAPGDTLMNMARACLGVTPEQTAADPRLAQAVGMLVKDMAARNPTIDPNNLNPETPVTISVSEATRLKADLGLTHSAQTEPQQTPNEATQPAAVEAPAATEQSHAPYEVRVIDQDAAVDIRALQASVGPDQIALLIWDADPLEVARQVEEFIAKRKVEIIGVSPVVVYAIARANHDRMPPSVQQGMDRFENSLVELFTGKTPQEVQAAQDAQLAQAEYANRLALNDEKTRIAQEIYGTGAHTTHDGYVLDPRGSFYLTEYGTFVQITDQLTRTLVLPEQALTPNDLSNFQEGYRLHSVATGEVPMGILRARLEELQSRGELYLLSDTPDDPSIIITPELFDHILVRETREMIAVWGGDPQALRPGVALPMPGKYYPANEQVHYAQRVITHNRSAGVTDEVEQLLYAVSVVEFLTRVQEQFPGLASEEMAQLAIILKEHPTVQLANLHDAEQVRGVIQQYLPSVNHGPAAGGEQENPLVAAVYADEGIRAILQNDPMNQGIIAILVNGLLSEGHVDAVVIASEVREQYMTQYRYHLGRAVLMDRADAINYLEFHTKVDTDAATALYDKMTAGGADPATLGSDVLDAIKQKTATHPSNNMNTTNMYEGGGVGPESAVQFDQLHSIFRGEPIAQHLLLTQPDHARTLYDSLAGTSPTQEELIAAFREDLMNQIETGMLALGEQRATEAEYLAFIQSLTSTQTSAELEPILASLHTDFQIPAADHVPDITKRGSDGHFDTFVSSYEIAELLASAREFGHNKDFLEAHRLEFERLYPNLWAELSQGMSNSGTETDRAALDMMRGDLWEALKSDVFLRRLDSVQNMQIYSFPEQIDFLRNFRALVGEQAYQVAINDVITSFEDPRPNDMAVATARNQQLDGMIISAITRLAHDPSIVLPSESSGHNDGLRPIQSYYIQPNDTLSSLAQKSGTTVVDLMELNGLTSEGITAKTYIMLPNRNSLHTNDPGDNSTTRADNPTTDSATAGEGNGVEVQAGDTMTQPLVEPGDNAVEVPPSGYTNPSDYNPDGTPITPDGQDAMSEPMVTPDMSQAMAMSDGPITEGSAPPVTLADGSASLGDAVRKSQGETAKQPPLTFDQVMKIIAEDGPAIEAYLQSVQGKYGPDSLALEVQLHEYIQANPDEVHRIIAKYMPEESTDTNWVWEEIDPATRDAIVKALLVTAAAAAAAGAAMGNTLSGGGA